MNQRVAFISRHNPTQEQQYEFESLGFHLEHVGDANAFDRESLMSVSRGFNFVCVVHPAAAMLLLPAKAGVFICENINRAAPGEPPRFGLGGLHLYRLLIFDDELMARVEVVADRLL